MDLRRMSDLSKRAEPEGRDPSKPTRPGELSASEKDAHPKRDKWDAAHLLVRAGLSAIPEFGGPAKELFTYVIVPPLEKRRADWMNAIAIRLKRLEEETAGFRLENLRIMSSSLPWSRKRHLSLLELTKKTSFKRCRTPSSIQHAEST